MNIHEDFLNKLEKIVDEVVDNEHKGDAHINVGSYEPFKDLIFKVNRILKSYQKPIQIEQAEVREELRNTMNKMQMKLDAATKGLADETKNRILLSHELKQSKKFVEDMLSSMPNVFIMIDRKTRVSEWNDAAEEFFKLSREDAIGKLLYEVYPQFDVCVEGIENALLNREHKNYQGINWTDVAEDKYYDITIFPLSKESSQGAIIQMYDVTQDVKYKDMLHQGEKMKSISSLSAGVAHEINNPIGSIVQNTQNIIRRLDKSLPRNVKILEQLGLEPEKLEKYIDEQKIGIFAEGVMTSAARASEIVDGLLKCSRISSSLTQENIHDIIDNAINIVKEDEKLENFKVSEIDFQKNFTQNVNLVPCIKGELETVLINIIKNSVFYLKDKIEKTIHIKTEVKDSYFYIEIQDNGVGIDKKNLDKVFEPFYTTKEIGEGIGLGLSVAYFIITSAHHGKISVESIKDKFTKVTIALPCSFMQHQ